MILCASCGTANREGSRFCNQCGARLTPGTPWVCPGCGADNGPEATHCRECGLDLARVRGVGVTGAEAKEPSARLGGGPPPWPDSVEWSEEEITLEEAQAGISGADAGDLEPHLTRGEWSADALPIEPVVGVPYRAQERRDTSLTSEQRAAAALFAAIAAEEVQAAPQEPVASLPQPLEAGLRSLLSLVLLLALLLPLIRSNGPWRGVGATPAPVAAAAKAINALPADATVLVAFEYDAGLAGEMQPVAEAYLQLILGRGLRILTISTQPEGAALADMALDRVSPASAGAYGRTVLNLGYVAGGEAAVRALAADLAAAAPVDYRLGRPLKGSPVLGQAAGARNLPLIVVLGHDLTGVQRWIEQVGAPYSTPLVAGTPALVEPAIEPYRSAGQLRGVVAGMGGAAALERLGSGKGSAGRMVPAVRNGAWAAAGLIVLANLAGMLGLWRRAHAA